MTQVTSCLEINCNIYTICQTEKTVADPALLVAALLSWIMHGIADNVTTANENPHKEERSAAAVLDGRIGGAKTTEIQAVEEKHGEATEVIVVGIGSGMTEMLIAEESIAMLEGGG